MKITKSAPAKLSNHVDVLDVSVQSNAVAGLTPSKLTVQGVEAHTKPVRMVKGRKNKQDNTQDDVVSDSETGALEQGLAVVDEQVVVLAQNDA
jgi:hypothetical protein